MSFGRKKSEIMDPAKYDTQLEMFSICDLELKRAVWPGDKNLRGFSVVED